MKKIQTVGIGEALVDVINGQAFAGGAPANFVQVINQLGLTSAIVSGIAKDEAGKLLLDKFRERNVVTNFLQFKRAPTGIVKVTLEGIDSKFELPKTAAWDFLEWNKELEKLAGKTKWVCFGSLGQRNPIARETIQKFIKNSNGIKLFDVNLRVKWNKAFADNIIHPSLKHSTIVKINEPEAFYFRKWLNAKTNEKLAKKLLSKYKTLQLVCVTLGENGCELYTRKKKTTVSGFSVKAVDTTGCGDAFSAGLAMAYLEGKSLEEIGEWANACGALCASEMGASPIITKKRVEKFLEQKRII